MIEIVTAAKVDDIVNTAILVYGRYINKSFIQVISFLCGSS